MVGVDLLSTWEYNLGRALLQFVLNEDGGSLKELSESQQQVLHELHSGCVLVAHPDLRPPVALSKVDSDRLPLGWQLRQQAGGSVPEPIGGDEVTRCLTRIARDSYCCLLAPPDLTINSGGGRGLPASDPMIGLVQVAMAHPLYDEAQELLEAEAKGWMDVRIESATGGDRLTDAPTPDSVIEAAAERWHHTLGGGAGDFMQAVVDCLAELRRLGAGETIEVPAVIGLCGMELEEGLRYELPVGLLRAPTDYERRYSPFFDVATKVDAVLETSIELRVFPSDCPEETRFGGSTQQRLVRAGRTVSLASALARRHEGSAQSAIAVAWITETTPLQGSGAFKPGRIVDSWVPSVDYGEDEVNALAVWAARVEAADLSNVEIAVERLLRALFEIEAGESLIDAVIAWENLLGTRNDTAYRVTAAMTILCEDEPGLRLKRQKELKGIYDRRSRMVHGDVVGADFALRNRAIQVGLDALARLITDHPALLKHAESKKRVDHLLLGIDGSGP